MIALLWRFRKAVLVLVGLQIVLAYAWPQAAREQFAAAVAGDMCKPPHECPAASPSAAVPSLIQALTGHVPAGPGVIYSEAQMEAALRGAGVPEPAAHVGAAIGEAESGGRSDAVHLCPPRCDPGQAPEQSYGPWQINLLAHRSVSVACAEALACAASATAAISGHGSNWLPWTTYANGAWRRYA